MNQEIAAILSNALLTPEEVGVVLRCNRNTLYNLIHAKEIPSVKFGAKYRVPAAWLKSVLGLTTEVAA
jgi:excisionase family DNA binding protein